MAARARRWWWPRMTWMWLKSQVSCVNCGEAQVVSLFMGIACSPTPEKQAPVMAWQSNHVNSKLFERLTVQQVPPPPPPPSPSLTSKQVRGQVSGKGSYQQPVALRGQLLLLVAVRAIQALVEHPWPRPPAGRNTATGAGWSSPCVPDPGTVRAVGVPEPRDPFPAASRWEIGAGISPSSAVEHWAALLASHDQVQNLRSLF